MTTKKIIGKMSYRQDIYITWTYIKEHFVESSRYEKYTFVEKIKYTFWRLLRRHYYIQELKCNHKQWKYATKYTALDHAVQDRHMKRILSSNPATR